MKNFSKQEFVLGMLSVCPIIFVIGIKAMWLMVIAGALWMCGGTFNKLIRRLGVPITVYAFSVNLLPPTPYMLAMIPTGFCILCIGDGFPDNRPTTRDEGSVLGRFVERFLSDDEGGGILTKLCIPILLQLAWLPIYIQ